MLASTLEGAVKGDYKRLIVEIPPRHSKSVHVSELLPAWILGHNPDLRIILASYSSGLSAAFSRRVRNTIETERYGMVFPGTRLARDSRSAQVWDIAGRHGGMIAAGVGSGITGHGADVLIIDDPVKDRQAAESTTIREATWDWYTSTARTRLHPGGVIIVCQTRWHYDDLAGRLLEGKDDEDKEDWTEVKFPALAIGDGDVLGRQVGDPLWPERYSADELRVIKAEVGTRDWTSLYQQEPTDEEGAIFPLKWWKYYDPDRFVFNTRFRTVQFWDTAFKEDEANDYSVGATWTKNPNGDVMARDWFKKRLQFPELKRAVIAQYDKWRPDIVYIEDKGSGQSLIQELRNTGLPIRAYKPDGSKEVRAHAVTPYIENGTVFLPERHPLLAEFLEEHGKFPAGKHDDMVDTTTMALELMARRVASMPNLGGAVKESAW